MPSRNSLLINLPSWVSVTFSFPCSFVIDFAHAENAATPYAATVSINDMQYGIGYGTSKKQAKSEAARATLEILIPEMKSKITADAKTGSSASKDQNQDLSVF